MVFDPEIHHRRSIRLKGYDYSQAGAYFVTICTQERQCLFGEIIDGRMQLNDAGGAVDACWHDIPIHFPNVELDEFVIMPNHVHGILVITTPVGARFIAPDNDAPNDDAPNNGAAGPKMNCDTNMGAMNCAPTVGQMVRAFKARCTHAINRLGNTPGKLWQRNYYERVIRNDRELGAIREYIVGNPAQWIDDEHHPHH